MVGTTTTKRATLMNEFLAGQSQRVYAKGRLYTRESPDGEGVQLVAYGNEILAEVEDSHVTLHIGHHGQVSRTVTGYVKVLGSVLSSSEGFEVTVHRDSAPTVGYSARHINSAAAQFIGNYVGAFDKSLSAVESDAIETVEDALAQILDAEFGDSE